MTPIVAGYEPRSRLRTPIEFALVVAALAETRVIVASVQAGPPVLPVSTPGLPYAVGRTDEDLVADCGDALAQVEAELRTDGAPVECRKLEGTTAARALHELAESEGAALLVVGAGRESSRVLHGAPCPVAVAPRHRAPRSLDVIGVAYVDDDESREALRTAHALARRAGAKLRVVTVVRVTPSMHAQTQAATSGRSGKSVEDVEGEYKLLAERHLREVVAVLGDDVDVEPEAFVGDPATTLIDLSRGLDALVAGSRGYGPLRAVLLGSVSRRLTDEAHCPVVVLPRGAKSALAKLMLEARQTA
jgi:nucleotide-binding universal stress UspA family protein